MPAGTAITSLAVSGTGCSPPSAGPGPGTAAAGGGEDERSIARPFTAAIVCEAGSERASSP